MNRSPLHGGPVRGNAGFLSNHEGGKLLQDMRSSQDARSNLAVQPAADAGSFKLKKNAVKIVSAAGPPPSAPLPKAPPRPEISSSPVAVPSLPSPASSPAFGLRTSNYAATKENELLQHLQPTTKPAPAPSARAIPPSKIDLPSQPSDGSLDDMFARLSTTGLSIPSRPAQELTLCGPDKSLFSFWEALDDTQTTHKASAVLLPKHEPCMLLTPAQLLAESIPDDTGNGSLSAARKTVRTSKVQGEPQNIPEMEYLRKAAMYLNALPSSPGHNVRIIKSVASKLHNTYDTDLSKLRPEDKEELKTRIVFAIVNYINKKAKHSTEPVAADLVKKVLNDHYGNFLRLCAVLVEKKYIGLDNLEQVTNLCQDVIDVLPKAEDSTIMEPNVDTTTNTAAPAMDAIKPSQMALGDPLDDMKAWPMQEKRERGAVYRACVLKGVGGVKTLNQLQALVWGGRLESISMPEPGSEHALVKFLTPEACQAFLDATENGIEAQGGKKKAIVFVDKQPGPNSINDVIQNCIDGDASRCVRATGADDDWSVAALFKLARGKQQIPREVDRIKQGKTARGHHFIEFRFGNIYHALNFRRYLMDDEEWEHCSIGYAPDPCEVANGVHYEDNDE